MDFPTQRHCCFQTKNRKENSLRFNPCDVRFNGPTQRHAGTIEQGGSMFWALSGESSACLRPMPKATRKKFIRPMALSLLSSIRQISGPVEFSEDKWSNSRPFLTAPIGLARSWQILDPINVARCKGSCFIVDRIF